MSLTDDDKRWLTQELAASSESLRREMSDLRTSFRHERTEDREWTKQQLADARQSMQRELVEWMQRELADVRDTFRREVADVRDSLQRELADNREWNRQQLEAMETKLLTAFHAWASPVSTRQRSQTALIRALDVELESLNDRVTAIENKLAS